ncbi:MAG TPA: multidrug efflux RND transporter permease subunit [Phycisphaerales bacterium]|nr:multidrug efflux RND transporter permease subunit [Phycisphaerales bacterium]
MLAEFPVRRPIVSCVIAILIVIMGVVAYPTLPIAQYPDITPPVVQVTTTYPGASAQVVADTVASPIEQQVNGVPGMLYMESTSASDGSYTLKVTFQLGTNIDIASVLVQNRVNIALPKLPDEVKRNGVTTDRVSSNIITVFALAPKDAETAEKYPDLFTANYLTINVFDEIKRISGVGDAKIFPAKDYGIRLWLDPDRLKSRDLTTMDVINALKEQNVQVAAGAIGQPPVPTGQAYQYNVSTLGRLSDVEQFENVIVRASGNRIIRVKDVARVELGGKSYDLLARYKGIPAAAMVVYQAPGGNAVQVARDVQKLLDAKTSGLPSGLEFHIIYDTSKFVLSAIDEVFHTFYEALALVLAVVVVFLGSLRLSAIPMLAIPVSIIGTFFFAKLFGFSVNLPVLFGLVVAIGIVVDDAIVVVENVEAVMTREHLKPKEATIKAMKEVLAPVMSITVVLMAVFVPTAFLPGISGQLFRQFALTIAASTFLSGVCAITLTPALCGVILKPHKEGHKPFILVRLFNRGFDALSGAYARFIKFLVHPAVIIFTLASFGACVVAIAWTFTKVPTGFVPVEDRGLILIDVWMPDAASQERTVAAVEKVEKILSETSGVRNYTALPGFSLINNNGSNYALFFIGLEDWDERLPKGRDFVTIINDLRQKTAQIPDALCIVFSLPAVDGVGNASGFDLRIQDRSGIGRAAMGEIVQGMVVDGNAQSKLRGVNSAYRAAVPQLFADIDREKVKKLGLPLQDVFSTLSGYLSAAYVNDFNLFGRTWQVNVSADSKFRVTPDDIQRLDVRKPDGTMVPLGAVLNVRETMGADRVIRYNIFPSAVLQGQPGAGVSSGEALKVVESMANEKLPQGTTYEWTALSFQEKLVGNQAIIVFSMALLVVYLILAALYESWFIPLSVILSIPLAVLGAMAGLMYRGMDNNIYTQVGLVLLVGLGAKNAILIVEFAKAYREQGKPIVESAVEASRQRLRPILMTAFAFILGVLPLMIATGAGAASRQAIGTAVFYGMIGNTFLGLLFTPVLYVVIQAVTEKIGLARKPNPGAEHATTAVANPAAAH